MKYVILGFLFVLSLSSCMKGIHVDLVVHNAQIHCLDDQNTISQAMAIKDGKIIEVGPERQILNKYSADEFVDAAGKEIYPGFTDAHGHILLYVKQKLSLDLLDCKSLSELVTRTEKYQQKGQKKFIVGRGWDQSLWGVDSMPDNTLLNKAFPNIPVCLYRVDGHAALVNDCLLNLAGISPTNVVGGEIRSRNGKCTGLLLDKAMDLVQDKIPRFSDKEIKEAILEVQEELFQYGITGVHEAGIEYEDIAIFKSLMENNTLKLAIYAMLMPSEKNKRFASENGVYRYKNLSIRSFKMFADGALGSKGAFLKNPYSDDHQQRGLLTTPLSEMQELSKLCSKIGYQLNTHAIGDSANKIILNLYKNEYLINKDHRWRIEHAQVIDRNDLHFFSDFAIFPSVQPTHAVSDQRWAESRLGKERIKGAYAYKSLLEAFGMVAIGTDFPIELTNPFLTIFAATQRKNKDNLPNDGFLIEEQLTLEQVLKGMTSWAAFAAFEENNRGTISKGKEATFFIVKRPIRNETTFSPNFAYSTYISGKMVYKEDELN
jgi:predicted amidohydrolase YtcJ